MNDDVWQAPGRAIGGDEAPVDHGRPLPGPGGGADGGGASPYNPYASPGGAPAPGHPPPYAGQPAASPAHPGPYGAFATSDRHRERVLGAAGYTTPAYRNDSVAVASLVLGIVGILVPGVFLLAILTGHIALRRLRRSYEGGRGLAVAGLVLGYVMLALWGSVFLMTLSTSLMLGI